MVRLAAGGVEDSPARPTKGSNPLTSPLVFLILPMTIAFAIFPGIFVLQLGL